MACQEDVTRLVEVVSAIHATRTRKFEEIKVALQEASCGCRIEQLIRELMEGEESATHEGGSSSPRIH